MEHIKVDLNIKEISDLNYPIIDYSKHPGFDFEYIDEDLSSKIENLINLINLEFSFLRSFIQKNSKNEKDLEINLNKQNKKIRSLIEELINLIEDLKTEKSDNVQSPLLDCVTRALKTTKNKIEKENNLIFKNHETNYNKTKLPSFDDLDKYGFCLFNFNESILNSIKSIICDELNFLINKSSSTPGPRHIISFDIKNKFLKFIKLKNIFKNTELFSVMKKTNKNIDILGISLEYYPSSANWYKDCYKDINLKTSKTCYFHVDYEYDYYKTIISLSDVKEDQGPLSYIPGSHKMPRNQFLFRYLKELDIELESYYKKLENNKKIKIKKNNYYYRKFFGSKELRKRLGIIPKQLLGHSHFGDDLLDSTEISNFLLKNEFKITSNIANTVLFNGHDGIHRAGLVENGSWFIMFITWGQKQNLLYRAIKKLSKYFIK